MAGSTYNTLTLDSAPVEEKRQNGLQKTGAVAAIVVAVALMFFAGRNFDEQSSFSQLEALDFTTCSDGQFIGGCASCKSCAPYEFKNGGCSGFKDTFCSFCEEIESCPRDNIICTNRYDQECTTCTCTDPAVNYGQVPDRDAGIGDLPYNCYHGTGCDECTVCKPGEYEVAPCSQDQDTQCAPCSSCGADEYVGDVCTYQTDTVCLSCDTCSVGNFVQNECYAGVNDLVAGAHVAGTQTVCAGCSACGTDEYTSEECAKSDPTADTQCSPCGGCSAGEYISTQCDFGDSLTTGTLTQCAACSTGSAGFWRSWECDPADIVDSQFSACTTCIVGEFELTPCEPEVDAVCPACTTIANCPAASTECSNDADQECTACADPLLGCCSGDFIGHQCDFERFDGECGGLPYKERTARSAGFNGLTNDDFVDFCKQMCAELSDCLAYDVPNESAPTVDSTCRLYDAHNPADVAGSDNKCFVRQ